MRILRRLFFLLMGLVAAAPFSCAAQSAQRPLPDALSRADAAFRAGYAARRAGKLEAARLQFAQVVRLEPSIAEGHEALGTVLLELGKQGEAVPELETAVRLKPGDAGAEGNLALACAKAGLADKAVSHFSAALDLSRKQGPEPADPGFFEAYARSLAATGKTQESIDMFKAAETRGGDRAELDDAIGSLYAQMGNWNDAQASFERAIEMDATYMPARIHLGIVLREVRKYEDSTSCLGAAVSQEPGNATAHFELGRTLEAENRDDAALPHLDQAARLDPELPGIQIELATVLQRIGRQQEAIPLFQKVLEREPRNQSALTNLGLALTLTGKAQDALPYFQKALSNAPNDVVIHKDLGVAHVQLSSFDEAIADFQSALALDPSDAELHYDLGLAYKLKDRVDDAVAELAHAEQLDPILPDPPYTLGVLFMQIGKMDEAAAELKKAAALRPGNGDVWAILGSVLKQSSCLDEARDALEKAIQLQPEMPGPRITIAGVFAEQASAAQAASDRSLAKENRQESEKLQNEAVGLRNKAAEYRRQAAVLSQSAVSRQKAAFALNAGNQLLLRGQIADAIARYQESLADDPTFAEAHVQLAVAYDRQGRTDDAEAERMKAKNLAQAK